MGSDRGQGMGRGLALGMATLALIANGNATDLTGCTLKKHQCICNPGLICHGSKCARGITSGKFDSDQTVATHGFSIKGPLACTDCECVPAGLESLQSVDSEFNAPRVFVGIKSSHTDRSRVLRQEWRKSDCARRYKNANIEFKFYINTPLKQDPELEREGSIEGDLALAPVGVKSAEPTSKVLSIFLHGYFGTTAAYVAEHDDDSCLDLDVVNTIIGAHEQNAPEKELYVSNFLPKGAAYEETHGPRGLIPPSTSGWSSLMSRKLVGFIVEDEWAQSILFGDEKGTADGANTGKWAIAAEDGYGVSVEYVHEEITIKDEFLEN